jgi:AcrR family transcriptional regulator
MSKATSAVSSQPIASRERARDLKPGVVAYKRARILEEASMLFFDRGYEAATLEILADRLSVTKPFLYTYFRNKGDILSAICEVGVQESLDALDRVSEQGADSVDRLRIALAEVAGIIIDRHEYIVVYQREMKNLDRADEQRIIRLRHEFDLRVARLVEACQRDGFVTLEDATTMSVWMGGLLSWITNCYRPGSRRSRETVIEQVVHACMRLIGLG